VSSPEGARRSPPSDRLFHHELCFGCGQQNLFGLQLELERRPDGGVAGRFFVKQDHQGPPGFAHGGVIAAALDEAMSLLLHGQGDFALTGRLEVDLLAPAPVGAFVLVEAEPEGEEGRSVRLRATASSEQGRERLATARGTFVRQPPPSAPR
jgi:acyl-coenzyme A thioesterase PaaI-like protein